MRTELVVVGCSLGGLDAIYSVLPGLPPSMPAIVIVQHRLAGEVDRLSSLIRSRSPLPVIEPDDKDPIRPGTVYIAPADYHLHIEPGWFSLSIDPAVKYARPSIDILFESAAEAYGSRVVGVILTGASDDGADGARTLVERGGWLLVQDPATAVSPIAPRAALPYASQRLGLDDIATALAAVCRTRPRRVAPPAPRPVPRLR